MAKYKVKEIRTHRKEGRRSDSGKLPVGHKQDACFTGNMYPHAIYGMNTSVCMCVKEAVNTACV